MQQLSQSLPPWAFWVSLSLAERKDLTLFVLFVSIKPVLSLSHPLEMRSSSIK